VEAVTPPQQRLSEVEDEKRAECVQKFSPDCQIQRAEGERRGRESSYNIKSDYDAD
jgi:hypothetical protein